MAGEGRSAFFSLRRGWRRRWGFLVTAAVFSLEAISSPRWTPRNLVPLTLSTAEPELSQRMVMVWIPPPEVNDHLFGFVHLQQLQLIRQLLKLMRCMTKGSKHFITTRGKGYWVKVIHADPGLFFWALELWWHSSDGPTLAWLREMLKMSLTTFFSCSSQSFKTQLGTLSGPVAFRGLILEKTVLTFFGDNCSTWSLDDGGGFSNPLLFIASTSKRCKGCSAGRGLYSLF